MTEIRPSMVFISRRSASSHQEREQLARLCCEGRTVLFDQGSQALEDRCRTDFLVAHSMGSSSCILLVGVVRAFELAALRPVDDGGFRVGWGRDKEQTCQVAVTRLLLLLQEFSKRADITKAWSFPSLPSKSGMAPGTREIYTLQSFGTEQGSSVLPLFHSIGSEKSSGGHDQIAFEIEAAMHAMPRRAECGWLSARFVPHEKDRRRDRVFCVWDEFSRSSVSRAPLDSMRIRKCRNMGRAGLFILLPIAPLDVVARKPDSGVEPVSHPLADQSFRSECTEGDPVDGADGLQSLGIEAINLLFRNAFGRPGWDAAASISAGRGLSNENSDLSNSTAIMRLTSLRQIQKLCENDSDAAPGASTLPAVEASSIPAVAELAPADQGSAGVGSAGERSRGGRVVDEDVQLIEIPNNCIVRSPVDDHALATTVSGFDELSSGDARSSHRLNGRVVAISPSANSRTLTSRFDAARRTTSSTSLRAARDGDVSNSREDVAPFDARQEIVMAWWSKNRAVRPIETVRTYSSSQTCEIIVLPGVDLDKLKAVLVDGRQQSPEPGRKRVTAAADRSLLHGLSLDNFSSNVDRILAGSRPPSAFKSARNGTGKK